MTVKPKALPTLPHSIEREYFRHLSKYVQTYRGLLESTLVSALPELIEYAQSVKLPIFKNDSARFDADSISDRILKLLKQVETRLSKAFTDKQLKRWNQAAVESSNRLSKRNMAKQAKVATDAEIEPLLNDKGLNPFFNDYINENISLVRSIGKDEHISLAKKLSAMISQDRTQTHIRDEIFEHFDVTKKRAALLARDQVNKLNGKLDEYRQKQTGVKRYRWRTMKDMRVSGRPGGLYENAKPSHWKREGKIFSWDNPPEGGHPKQRVNCRCYAEPVFNDLE